MDQSEYQARDPNFEGRVRDSFARQAVMGFLGAGLLNVAPGRCDIGLDYRTELSQQHGYFHGGIVGTIGDSAAGYAGYSLMPEHSSVLTVEYKMNLMAPADGDRLVAEGRVIRPGRTLVVARADVFVIKNGERKQTATLLQTLMCLHDTPDTAPAAA